MEPAADGGVRPEVAHERQDTLAPAAACAELPCELDAPVGESPRADLAVRVSDDPYDVHHDEGSRVVGDVDYVDDQVSATSVEVDSHSDLVCVGIEIADVLSVQSSVWPCRTRRSLRQRYKHEWHTCLAARACCFRTTRPR